MVNNKKQQSNAGSVDGIVSSQYRVYIPVVMVTEPVQLCLDKNNFIWVYVT